MLKIHRFTGENRTYTETVFFGVESMNSLKGQQNLNLFLLLSIDAIKRKMMLTFGGGLLLRVTWVQKKTELLALILIFPY